MSVLIIKQRINNLTDNKSVDLILFNLSKVSQRAIKRDMTIYFLKNIDSFIL